MAIQNRREKNQSLESFKGILNQPNEDNDYSSITNGNDVSKTIKQSVYDIGQSINFMNIGATTENDAKIVEIIQIQEFEDKYNSNVGLKGKSDCNKDSEKVVKAIVGDLINEAIKASADKKDMKKEYENENTDNHCNTDRRKEIKKMEDFRNNLALGIISNDEQTELGELQYLKSLLRTDADMKLLPIRIYLKLNEQNFFSYIFNDFIENQDFIGIFIGKSIFDPFYLRVMKLLFNLSIMFGLNAYFFTEDAIDSQTEAKTENGGESIGFEYVLVNQIMNYMWPIIITNLLLVTTNFILRIPQEFKMSLFEKLKNPDTNIQLAGIYEYNKNMRLRYSLWTIIVVGIHICLWYFVVIFCSVYVNSNKEWLIGGIIAIGLDLFVFKLMYSVIKGILRQLAIWFPISITVKLYQFSLWVFNVI